LVAEPLEVVDLRNDPEVIDLRDPDQMTWEESAVLIQLPDDLADQIADRRREEPTPGRLRAKPGDAPPMLPRNEASPG
jgi:hypothetical protein